MDKKQKFDAEYILTWLMEGDVSIQYQAQRDLLGINNLELQKRIATEGWGARFLQARHADGHWGQKFYQPKWTSSHYTLLDLRHLCFPSDHPLIQESIVQILETLKAPDGGILPIGTDQKSDLCINGMVLNYACYFQAPAPLLNSIVDMIIAHQMADGGFNCRINRSGAVHSSLHTTISVLEGLWEYIHNGYTYQAEAVERMAAEAREFILQHQFFRSDHTGEIIDKRFLMLSFPSRWRYDILRGLAYFQISGQPYDPRMQPALDVLFSKRRQDGMWPVQAKHLGQTHFEMEKTGGASRWNTLRAWRVLRHFGETPSWRRKPSAHVCRYQPLNQSP